MSWPVGAFAAIVLLFTGRYPPSMYGFVLGMNRWAVQAAAYAGLIPISIRRSGWTRAVRSLRLISRSRLRPWCYGQEAVPSVALAAQAPAQMSS